MVTGLIVTATGTNPVATFRAVVIFLSFDGGDAELLGIGDRVMCLFVSSVW
jgi:hypothetical protein